MRDQVRIKNVVIRVIKRDRVWNDDREEKNEEKATVESTATVSQVAKKNRTIVIAN